MVLFEISVNRERPTTLGYQGRGALSFVLNANQDAGAATVAAPDGTGFTHPIQLLCQEVTEQRHEWFKRTLLAGDEVVVRILPFRESKAVQAKADASGA